MVLPLCTACAVLRRTAPLFCAGPTWAAACKPTTPPRCGPLPAQRPRVWWSWWPTAWPLLRALRSALEAQIFGPAPPLHAVVLATQGRVALGDGIADALNARAVLVLLGERPGLSSPDSLGGYLSWRGDPGFAGLRDAERNCVSNIRSQGQAPELAAWRIAWLLAAAARLGATGVVLKDGSEAAIATLAAPQAAPPALAGQSAPCSGNTP
jgi:hypothetical protein